jgi:ribosomal protein S18 acetylase RimI-like enzyme
MLATYKSITEPEIEIAVEMMRDFYAIDNYPIDCAVSEKLLREFISDENLGRAWLILLDNTIVGYAILTFVFSFEYGGRIAFLDELYVSEAARGKGIGKQTVQFIQSEAQKLSLKRIYLEVEPHNEKAQQLYVSNGFETHKRKLMQYKVNNTKPN